MRGYPTLLLFEDGLFMEKYSGNRALDKLIEFVEENMQGEEEVGGCAGDRVGSFVPRPSGLGAS